MNNTVFSHGMFSNSHSERTSEALSVKSSASYAMKTVKGSETQAQKGESLVREAEKQFVLPTTPAATINISSEGKAAVNTLNKLNEGLKNVTSETDNIVTDKNLSETFKTDIETTENGSETVASEENVKESNPSSENTTNNFVGEARAIPSSHVNSSNLTPYSEVQLRNMVNDGTISRSDMDYELERRISEVKGSSEEIAVAIEETAEASTEKTEQTEAEANPLAQQAIAAYSFQMSFEPPANS